MSDLMVLIIDDEVGAREALNRLVDRFCPEITKVVAVADAEAALAVARQQPFDLAFIDIELRHSSGLELAEQLVNYCSNLIFVTAYDKYAVKAFQTPAINYLLKPVLPRQLQQAVSKVAAAKKSANQREKILLPIGGGMTVIEQANIIRVAGEGNYCTFYCQGGKSYFLSRHLAHYEALLNPDLFYRCHQSHLLKLSEVREYSTEGGSWAVLKNGDRVPVAVRRKEGFLAALATALG